MSSLVIPARFNGPPTSGNGGVTAGLLAAHLPADRTIQVTLRQPPPLDTQLRVEQAETGVRASAGDVVVVEALVVEQQIEAVSGVDFRSAAEAATRFDGYTEHPFPTCFGCGLERPQHDGLALYAGKVDGRESARVATPFVPREGTGPDRVLIWAALDCPGGWSIGLLGRRAVLGQMTARIHDVARLGEHCVVVAECDRWEGRKAFSRSTVYGADERVLGVAAATWIELR